MIYLLPKVRIEETTEFLKRMSDLPNPFAGELSGQDMADNGIGYGFDAWHVPTLRGEIETNGLMVVLHTLTDEEILYCERVDNPLVKARRYAKKLAAKEAVTKALGLNGGRVNFKEISVLKEDSGKPYIHLAGKVAEYANRLGATRLLISLSHEKDFAFASCIAARGNNE